MLAPGINAAGWLHWNVPGCKVMADPISLDLFIQLKKTKYMLKKSNVSAPVCRRHATPLTREIMSRIRIRFGGLMLVLMTASALAQPSPVTFDDHQNLMDQLGVKKLRPGPNPNDQSTFDEALANPYTNSMPDVLTMKDGTKVTRPEQWPARRAEIQECDDNGVWNF